MSADTIVDIFQKAGVAYSTSADLYSTTTIGAALPTIETASVVDPPMGGGGPSSDPLVITFNPLVPIPTPPDMTPGVPITPIDITPYFTGGPPPKVYSIFSGTLPAGLTMLAGLISGTPSTPGASTVVFKGTDNAGNSANSNGVPFTVAALMSFDPAVVTSFALSNGNRTVTFANTTNGNARSLAPARTGKIYAEVLNVLNVNPSYQLMVGFGSASHSTGVKCGYDANSIAADNLCQITYNGGNLGTYASLTTGDRWMLAYDTANGKFWVGKNGTWFASGNPAAGTGNVGTGPTGAAMYLISCVDTAPGSPPFGTITGNFVASQLVYTLPTGFTPMG